MKVGANSVLYQNTTVRGPTVTSESTRWVTAAISLDSSFHSTCRKISDRLLTKLLQTSCIRIDLRQGLLDGIHELLN